MSEQVTQLASVTLQYRDLDHLIAQIEELKRTKTVGLYTVIQLEKDWDWIYRQEQINE